MAVRFDHQSKATQDALRELRNSGAQIWFEVDRADEPSRVRFIGPDGEGQGETMDAAYQAYSQQASPVTPTVETPQVAQTSTRNLTPDAEAPSDTGTSGRSRKGGTA